MWSALGDSVAGTSHRAREAPCQDSFRFRTPGDWLVVAVADGAGTAAHAHAGAELACDEFVRRAEALVPAGLTDRAAAVDLFAAVRAALVAEADRLGVRPRELACTALFVLAGPGSVAVAQVGDGAVVLGDGAGYRAAFWPDPAGYANATDFLTDDGFADALRFVAEPAVVRDVAVLTDGLQRLALDFAARAPHDLFFRPLFDRLRATPDPASLVEPFRLFLDSPRVNERTDDDKTLVLATRLL